MWQSTPYTIPLMVGAVVAIAVALFVWRTRDTPLSKTAVLLLFAAACWIAGYALELAAADLPGKVLFEKVQFIGASTVPVGWFVYTLQYTARRDWLTRARLILLCIVPLAALLLALTNEAHNLIWRNVRLDTSGPVITRQSEYGIGLWVYTAYSYALLLVSAFLLIQALARSRHLYRWQATALLSVVLGLWLINALTELFSWEPLPNLEMTPFALGITIPVIAWALFRLRLADIVPVAREAVIESMEDGVVVLDASGRVVDLNSAAESIGDLRPAAAVGQPLWKVWPELSDRIEGVVSDTPSEVSVGLGEGRRTYDVRVSPLSDWRGRMIGQILVLRDISRRKQAEDDLHRAEERTRRQLEEQSALLQATRAVSSTVDLEDVLDRIAREMVKVAGVHGCTISHWDREADAVVTWLERRGPGSEGADAPGTTYALKDFPTTREVLETGQPATVRLSDPEADPAEVAHMRKVDTTTLLMLPLAAGQRVIGLVELDQEEERHFTNDEIRLCQALADQAAVAIENARLLTETERQLKVQLALREAGTAISSTLDWQTVLTRIAEQMAQSIDATSAYIATFDAEAKTSTVIVEFYSPAACAAEQIPDLGVSYTEDEESWLGKMTAGHHDISHIDDPELTEFERTHMEQHGAQTILYIPLRSRGYLVGYAELWESRRRREFTDEEISLCQAIAQSAAVALDNAQLYEQLRQELRGRETLLEISAAVSSSLDLGKVLLTLSDRLLSISQFHNCTISEWEEHSLRVRTLAEHTRAIWGPEAKDTYSVQAHPTTAKVLQTGQPAVVRSGEDDPEVGWMDEIGLKVVLFLPLRAGAETIGLVELGSLEPGFSFEDANVQRCLQVLREASLSIEPALRANPDHSLMALASQLVSASGSSWCTISEYDPMNDEVRSMVEYGDLSWVPGEGPSYYLPDWEMGWRALREGVPAVATVDDPDCDPGTRADLMQWGGQAMALIPLSVRGEGIGFIELYDFAERRTVSDDEMRLWRAVADQAALAIENARLYRKAQQDLTELARAEEQLRTSVLEKEVLLREIHHRVKNNLQVISSLLNLQASRIDDERIREAFRASQDRIRSMALVHERLYQSADLAKVDFAEYVRNLTLHLLRSHASEPRLINLIVDADQIFMDVDSAVPCGLIIAELVSNALRHAFPAGGQGRISVSLKPRGDGVLLLSVSDDGVGMPPDLDPETSDTLGLQLVRTLAEQLSAEIELDREGGTEFRITFSER